MLLVTSIYAILAVNFYSCRSPEFFGSFTRALFTLFQICTGDGWASDIARPIFQTVSACAPDSRRGVGRGDSDFFESDVHDDLRGVSGEGAEEGGILQVLLSLFLSLSLSLYIYMHMYMYICI